jgi:hypothetical protein
MVTPLLFSVRDDRVWMVVPRSSAKVSAIARNPVVGLAAGTPGAMAVLQGEARVVDPLRPRSFFESLPEALLGPRAFGGYVAEHLPDLAGLVGPGALAPRTLAALRPQRAIVARDGADLWSTGAWPEGAAPYGEHDAERRTVLPLDEVPADLRARPDEPGPVIVGWATAAGPVALPGTWDPATGGATVRTDLLRAAGCLPQSAACILFDGTEGTGLDGKTGVVVRGRGTARLDDAGTGASRDAVVSVRTERVSWWQGDESHTVRAGG